MPKEPSATFWTQLLDDWKGDEMVFAFLLYAMTEAFPKKFPLDESGLSFEAKIHPISFTRAITQLATTETASAVLMEEEIGDSPFFGSENIDVSPRFCIDK
jgi:hypothetical protein